MSGPRFTVFTPTFNRAHTLRRPFESLVRQTCRDFEWLVVDDGSTDGTAELLRDLEREASFPMRVVRQENRGKHTATNRAVREARAPFFVTLDSDDACERDALERLALHWERIPAGERDRFSGVVGRCRYAAGGDVGRPLPRPVVDLSLLELRYRLGLRGEMWGFTRTDLLRAYPFPETVGSGYVPESLVWDRIALRYRTRFVEDVLRVYHFDPGSGSLGTPADPARAAIGNMMQQAMVLDEQLDWFRDAPVEFLRAAAHYVRFSLHAGRGFAEQRRTLRRRAARLLWASGIPAGYLAHRVDQRRRSRA